MALNLPNPPHDERDPINVTAPDGLVGHNHGYRRGLVAGVEIGKAAVMHLVAPLIVGNRELTPDVPNNELAEIRGMHSEIRLGAVNRLSPEGLERATRISMAMAENFHERGVRPDDFDVVGIPKPGTEEEKFILVHTADQGLVMPRDMSRPGNTRITRFLDRPTREAVTIKVEGEEIDTRLHTTKDVLAQVTLINPNIHEYDWVAGRPGPEGRGDSYAAILISGNFIPEAEQYMGSRTVLRFRPSALIE